jgi:hypothetical protein
MSKNDPIRIPHSAKKALKTDFANTGKTLIELFKDKKVPGGLEWRDVYEFLRAGKIPIQKSHFRFLKRLFKENKVFEYPNYYVDLTPSMRERLTAEIGRTGLQGSGLIGKLKRGGINPRVSTVTIYGWLDNKVKMASWLTYAFTLDYYSLCPDKPPAQKKPPERRDMRMKELKPISSEELAKLRYFMDDCRIKPMAILNNSDAPDGLKPSTISAWKAGKIKSAKPEYLEWVFKRCEDLNHA